MSTNCRHRGMKFQQFIAATGPGTCKAATPMTVSGKHRPMNGLEEPRGFVQSGTHPRHMRCRWNDAEAYAGWFIRTKNGTSIPAAKAHRNGSMPRAAAARPFSRGIRNGSGRVYQCETSPDGSAGRTGIRGWWSVFRCDDGYVYHGARRFRFKTNSFGLNEHVGQRFSMGPRIAGTRTMPARPKTTDRARHRRQIAPSMSFAGVSWFSTPGPYLRANYRKTISPRTTGPAA